MTYGRAEPSWLLVSLCAFTSHHRNGSREVRRSNVERIISKIENRLGQKTFTSVLKKGYLETLHYENYSHSKLVKTGLYNVYFESESALDAIPITFLSYMTPNVRSDESTDDIRLSWQECERKGSSAVLVEVSVFLPPDQEVFMYALINLDEKPTEPDEDILFCE